MTPSRRLLTMLAVLLFTSTLGGAAVPSEEPGATAEAPVPNEPTRARRGGRFVPPPPPHRTLQTLVDERRDLLRKHRSTMLERYGDPGAHKPPWLAPYNAGVERYRNERRLMNRQRRDYDRQRRNGWMDSLCPWSKPRRDWSRQRNYLMQMEQLDRQEHRDALGYRTPLGYPGPIEW